jgi:hypothetical protein
VLIGGLSPATTYHFRIVATNVTGTTDGLDQSFTTLALAPTATTFAATEVSATGATLNGMVNPGGAPATYQFDYGTTTEYGTSVPFPGALAGSDLTAHTLSKSITGLQPNTTYHFRIAAVNSIGVTDGTDQMFTTAASTSPPPPPLPVLSGLSVKPRAFRAAASGGSIAAATRKKKSGATIGYSDSAVATTTFVVQRAVKGIRRGSSCLRLKGKAPKHARKCTAFVTVDSFTHTAGSNSFRFSGRVGGRKLAPGSYVLAAQAADAAGSSTTVSAKFKVLK